MPRFCSHALLAALFAASVTLTGCGGSTKQPAGGSGKPNPKQASKGESQASGDQDTPEFMLGDMLEPFDPPALEELEAEGKWIDRPVHESLDILREQLAEQPTPELTAAEALQQKNDSARSNEQLLAAVGQLPAADGHGIDYDASIVRHVSGDLKSTNPILASSVTEFEYHDLASIGLLTFDRNFEWFGDADIIRSWQTREDRLVDKFVLRDDLTWSDGKPVTAHDVEFAFNAIMTQAVICPAVRQGTDELKAVKAYDDHTVVIFHKAALPTNDENMQFYIMPKHIFETTLPDDPTLARSPAHSRLEDKPVVAGKYELAKRQRGQEFILRRREGYYLHDGKQVRQMPYFKEVRVKWIEDLNTALLALKSGDIEQMELKADQWVTQTDGDDYYRLNTKATGTEWTEFHFNWNTKSPLFADAKTRWAMTYAMDYEELLETICYGLYSPCQGTFHPESWMFPKNGPAPVAQDLEKAEQLLAEAGWEDTDGDGIVDKEIDGRRIPFEFTMLTFQTDNGIKCATLMKECLDLVGIVCNVKPTEFTVLVQKTRDKEYQAAMAGWGTGTDPSTLENIFGTDAGRNYGSYSHPEVDRLFDQGKREFDREKRAEIYGKIHTQLWEDQPYTWLFYRNSFYGFSKKLRGYNFSPRGPFNYSPGFHSLYVPAAP